MPKIYFVDVTNRDGVQTSRLGLAKLQKTIINLMLDDMGITQSEFGFPTTMHELNYLNANLDLVKRGVITKTKMSGFGFSIKMALDHIALEKRVADYLLNSYKPDLVLLIDYGTFNLRVAKRLKGSGIKVFHYIPPQVWASRKWRIKGIKKYVDEVLCIFPFEIEMYQKEGINVHYCGHPLIKQLPEKADREQFFAKHGLDTTRPLVSIFPGSRTIELRFLANTFIKSAKQLQKKHPSQ